MALTSGAAGTTLALAVVAGCGGIYVLESLAGRRESRHRIAQLEEMTHARFDPPATPSELRAVDDALSQQRDWLQQRWHVLPWAPTMPWAELPMDAKHRHLSQ